MSFAIYFQFFFYCLIYSVFLGLPQRVILALMGFLALAIAFSMRACLSVAITEMVLPLNNTGKGNESLICPADLPPTENNTHSRNVTFKFARNFSFFSISLLYFQGRA